ncbi:MAG: hypothetical protein Q9195_003891 [Heterodermia aff. obscurata]
MEPWQSWVIVGIAGVGAYMYYAKSKKTNRTRNSTSLSVPHAQRRASEVRGENNERRKKGKSTASSDRPTSDAAEGSSQSVPTSGNEKTKKGKGGKKGPSQLTQSASTAGDSSQAVEAGSEDPQDDGIDNKEFAKQLSSLKSGISLQKSANTTEIKKSKKLGKQNESLLHSSNGKVAEPSGGTGSHEMSTTSSTTGADADDDLSPAMSPAFGATVSTKNAGDVADMLEAPVKGPSVLRLTQPTQPQPDRQPKEKKVAPEPETKKQRQRRKKNEEQKAAREEGEKERRVLMENQRRVAREAEGRPAKNGLGTSKAPTASVWAKPMEKATLESTGSPLDSSSLLLDTFDDSGKHARDSIKTETNGTTATSKTWNGEMPSEEEQLRMLSEADDNGWNTVQKGGKSKKKRTELAGDQPAETESPKMDFPASEKVNSENVNEPKKEISAAGSHENGGESQGSYSSSSKSSKPKTTRDQVDPKVWNQGNIHNHPDYDPEYP